MYRYAFLEGGTSKLQVDPERITLQIVLRISLTWLGPKEKEKWRWFWRML